MSAPKFEKVLRDLPVTLQVGESTLIPQIC